MIVTMSIDIKIYLCHYHLCKTESGIGGELAGKASNQKSIRQGEYCPTKPKAGLAGTRVYQGFAGWPVPSPLGKQCIQQFVCWLSPVFTPKPKCARYGKFCKSTNVA